MAGAKKDSSDSKRPPLSCAECRRLKLKCNRTWPCSSCQKRGLAEICPEGSLATRPRHKTSPPTPQHVIERIYELQARINELESALSALQATVSTQPHPLLKSNPKPYLQRKLMRKSAIEKAQALENSSSATPTETLIEPNPGGTGDTETGEQEGIIQAFGTLSIAADGRSRFFGPTAVSEGLSIEQETTSSTKPTNVALPVDIAALAWQYFPFASLTDAVETLFERISAYLPPLERANSLCVSYFSYASLATNIVPEDEFFEDLFFRLYGTQRHSGQSPDYCQGEHKIREQWASFPRDELSVFFCILALGALTDLSAEPFNEEAETYYQLSRALLTRDNVLSEPTLASIQTLFLGSYYEGMRSQGSGSRDSWIVMAAASKTVQVMGLHRDQSMFGLDKKEVNRRRVIFWETYSLDLMQSLELGRPLSTVIAHTDTQMPRDTFKSTVDSSTGEVEESFYQWKYRFCAEVGSVVSDHVLRVKPPSYASALETDRILRQFVTTFGRGLPEAGNWVDPTTAAQYQMMIGTRETYMLYIHRGFFAHVMSAHPIDPEKSKYGKSVTAAYESACRIIEGMQIFVRHHPEFAARVWFLWNHVLSASFILGSLVVHAPGCPLAAPAAAQLDNVYEMLKQESLYRGRAEYMLPVISKLRVKGYNARIKYQAGSMANSRPHSTRAAATEEDDDHDELSVIGGKARVVISSASSQSSLSPPPPPLQSQTASPSPENYPVRGHFTQQDPNVYPLYPPDVQAQDMNWAHAQTAHEHALAPQLDFIDPTESLPQHFPLGDYNPYGVPASWGDGEYPSWQTLVQDLSGG